MIDDAILRTALEARKGFDLCGCPEGECERCKGEGWLRIFRGYARCPICNGAGRTREKCWESATCSCAQAMRQALEAVCGGGERAKMMQWLKCFFDKHSWVPARAYPKRYARCRSCGTLRRWAAIQSAVERWETSASKTTNAISPTKSVAAHSRRFSFSNAWKRSASKPST